LGQAPTTVLQLGLLVLVVLPGITYQFLRERWRGPVPGERDLGERVLRSLVASMLLDALYLIVAGPALARLAKRSLAKGWGRGRRAGAAVGAAPEGRGLGERLVRLAVVRHVVPQTAWIMDPDGSFATDVDLLELLLPPEPTEPPTGGAS
jgi:hypothetical protein